MALFGGANGSRGGGWRLMIGLIIAVVGLISYWRTSSVNPVTGEKQHVSLTVEQEKALGLRTAPQMAAEMGGALDPQADSRARLVASLGQRIIERSDAERSPYHGNFHFYLLADPKTVNAFALPGGQIFITAGLFDRLENEAQLAGVLGHEIGHVINRHSAEQMAKGQLGQSLAVAVGVAATDDRGGNSAAAIAQVANQLIQLRYSRGDELEADQYGLKYMVQAGFNPEAMLRVMEILKQASGGGNGPDFLATHPDPDARIAQIREYLKANAGRLSADLTMGSALNRSVGR